MDQKAKVITGASAFTIFLVLLHIFHGVDAITNTRKSELDNLKNAPVYIIQKDSVGKTDTMLMKEYLRQQDSIRSSK